MKNVIWIAKKEWFGYLVNPLSYIFSGLFLLISSWLFFQDFFVVKQAETRALWTVMTFLFSIFIPAISMGLIAEEKRSGSWEVLFSLPISEVEFVLGKFFGSLAYIFFIIIMASPIILTVGYLGDPEWGLIFGGGLGMWFLAASYLASGLFGSSLSRQPIGGFVFTTLFLFLNNFIGQDFFLSKISSPKIADFIGYFSLNLHSLKMSSGMMALNDLMFYISWIVIFLILTVMSLKLRDK